LCQEIGGTARVGNNGELAGWNISVAGGVTGGLELSLLTVAIPPFSFRNLFVLREMFAPVSGSPVHCPKTRLEVDLVAENRLLRKSLQQQSKLRKRHWCTEVVVVLLLAVAVLQLLIVVSIHNNDPHYQQQQQKVNNRRHNHNNHDEN
jgi:hypothetical protein